MKKVIGGDAPTPCTVRCYGGGGSLLATVKTAQCNTPYEAYCPGGVAGPWGSGSEYYATCDCSGNPV